MTKANPSRFYDPRDGYELIRVITPDAEVFISEPGIFRINARSDGRTELIVRKGEAVINGRQVKKERRAVTSSEGVTIAEIDSKTEDSFDRVGSRTRGHDGTSQQAAEGQLAVVQNMKRKECERRRHA